MALNCHADQSEFANTIFPTTSNLFKKLKIANVAFNSVIGRELCKLLNIPLEHYKNVITLTQLESYGDVLKAFDYKGRTHICSAIINNMIEFETVVEKEEQVDKIFIYLLVDEPDQPKDTLDAGNLEDFEEEQSLVAKLVHMIHNEDLEQHFKLLNKILKSFGQGGAARLKHTLPATIFATYRLLLRYNENRNGMMTNFTEMVMDEQKVVECLKKSIKIASQCME